MAASSRGSWLRLPRPKTFLGLISLPTGTELIALSLLFNKATGAYGLLAVFTGYALSAAQLSMYLSSVACLAALALLLPHVRRRSSPFHALALAWLYAADTLANAAYVAAFAVLWYRASASPAPHDPQGPAGAEAQAGTGAGVEDGAPAAEADRRRDGQGGAPAAGVQETAVSMLLVVLFTVVIRIYFALVVAAFARSVVLVAADAEEDAKGLEDGNPFAEGREGGKGWQGWLGRKMIAVGRSYWLGGKEDEEWTRNVGRKFGGAAE